MKAHEMLPDGQNTVQVDGVTVRKGSVGAFLASWRICRDEAETAATREQARQDLLELIPALRTLGLFEVFEARDPALRQWIGQR